MNRVIISLLVAAVLLIGQSRVYADMLLKDKSDELYEKSGSPILGDAIIANNKAILRAIIRDEVDKYLAEKQRLSGYSSEQELEYRERQLREAVRSLGDDLAEKERANRKCVQDAGVRAYLDCY